MRFWGVAAACFGAVFVVARCEPASAYIADDRWSNTATNPSTGPQGTPVTITWSLAPDGTDIPADLFGTVDSGLIGFLDEYIGAGPGGSDLKQRPWFTYFDQA